MKLRGIIALIAAPLLAVVITAMLSGLAVAHAEEPIDRPGEPVPRLILALYDGTREGKIRWTRLHRYAELVLNHLGFRMLYHDIARGMPPDILDADYSAVLSWFDAPVPDAQTYAAWASAVRTQGRPAEQLKFIVLAETGLSAAAASGSKAQAFLGRVGIDLLAAEHHFGAWGRLADSDPALIGFEGDFTVSDLTFPLIMASPSHAVSHLRVTEPAALGGTTTDLVVTAPTGAYVHGSVLVRRDPNAETSPWILNPFSFFERLIGDELRPIPDTTTLNGRRIFFSTLHGEGWTTPLPADRPGEPVRLAGSVILDELIAPYPDLPVSVALVTGELDQELGGRFAKTGEEIARAALALPQVELASGTRSLPLRWGIYEDYRRDVEMQTVERIGTSNPSPKSGVLTEAFSSLAEVVAGNLSRASAGRATALRRYISEPFDLDAEIAGSLDALKALAPARRSAALMSWGGDAQVFEGALLRARLAGVAAMGGGGGLYDSVAPSISNLTPLSVQVGAERQIYNALAGDAIYTNFWTEPIHGLLRLLGVLEATEQPRLKPFHLSYSAFSSLRFGSLNAIKTLLNRARADFVAPIHASHFARIAEGFDTVRVLSSGPLQWRIEHRGALQTVRFDTDDVELDTARCQGVLGGRREGGTYYVSLDPAEERPVVALKTSPISGERGPGETDAVFELDNARWMVRELASNSCKAAFKASGFGPGEMTWRVPRRGDFRIEMHEDAATQSSERPVYWDDVIVQDDKMLSLSLPDFNGRPVRVVMSSCR